jgi:uncharacterized protein YbaR (Trm112 family)
MSAFEISAFVILGGLAVGAGLLVLALLWSAAGMRRAMDRLARTPCPVCRETLGLPAVREGVRRAQALARQEEEAEQEPVTSEIIETPTWLLVCPRCQSELVYDWRQRKWSEMQPPHNL